MKAIVVDKDYGSVTSEELARVAAAYAAAGIEVQLLEYQVSAAQQKEPQKTRSSQAVRVRRSFWPPETRPSPAP